MKTGSFREMENVFRSTQSIVYSPDCDHLDGVENMHDNVAYWWYTLYGRSFIFAGHHHKSEPTVYMQGNGGPLQNSIDTFELLEDDDDHKSPRFHRMG